MWAQNLVNTFLFVCSFWSGFKWGVCTPNSVLLGRCGVCCRCTKLPALGCYCDICDVGVQPFHYQIVGFNFTYSFESVSAEFSRGSTVTFSDGPEPPPPLFFFSLTMNNLLTKSQRLYSSLYFLQFLFLYFDTYALLNAYLWIRQEHAMIFK